ncbi:putative membrane protein-like [Capsicum annuum]|nr:putative membrane protein-like [Capsicum annuum]KAF3642748.1 putative membrane protein-like [Capsicum annuum]
MYPTCSKPTRFCLCTRLKTPCLENSIAVTILQHSLEKNHPLNSTRIASIGLKILSVISVFDVNYEAEFVIQFLNSNLEMGSQDLDENLSCANSSLSMPYTECETHPLTFFKSPSNVGENSSINIKDSNFDSNAAVSFTIEKYGAICSFQNQDLDKPWKQPLAEMQDKPLCSVPFLDPTHSGGFCAPDCALLASENQDLNKRGNSGLSPDQARSVSFSATGCPLLASIDDTRKAFLVKKIQRKLLDGSSEFQEVKEFEVSVPPAKRMYNENPWLKMLPHVRLDVEKLSLYSEVRRQPKAGCLSTIESIVYALKAVGEENSKGLDHLLDVFESMVVDQRRCKDEGVKQRLANCDELK